MNILMWFSALLSWLMGSESESLDQREKRLVIIEIILGRIKIRYKLEQSYLSIK